MKEEVSDHVQVPPLSRLQGTVQGKKTGTEPVASLSGRDRPETAVSSFQLSISFGRNQNF